MLLGLVGAPDGADTDCAGGFTGVALANKAEEELVLAGCPAVLDPVLLAVRFVVCDGGLGACKFTPLEFCICGRLMADDKVDNDEIVLCAL